MPPFFSANANPIAIGINWKLWEETMWQTFQERHFFIWKVHVQIPISSCSVFSHSSNSTKELLIITSTKWLCLCVNCSDSDRAWRHLYVGHQAAASQSSACYCKSPPIVHLSLWVVDVASVFFLYHKKNNQININQQIPWKKGNRQQMYHTNNYCLCRKTDLSQTPVI